MADEQQKRLRWQDLSGQQRYQVIELLRKQEVSVVELCRTFGVSRQTLYRAAEAADRASIAALTPKRRGRKPTPASGQQLRQLTSEKTKLEQELGQMRQKYEIAQALLDLQRKAERGERLPGEKKTVRPTPSPAAAGAGLAGTAPPMAAGADGDDAGGDAGSAGQVDRSPRRGDQTG